MYDRNRRAYYCLHMANDVYTNVMDCHGCARIKPFDKLGRHRQIFRGNGSLEFVAMYNMGPVLKTIIENQFVLVAMDRYSKLARDVPTSRTAVSHIVSHFMDNWIIPYGIRRHLLTGNGTQFVSKFSESLCIYQKTKHFTASAYHHEGGYRQDNLTRRLSPDYDTM